ncbi:MAG: alkaline phosphatase PhoX [Xenococcaceae cyanobacterium]
MSLSRRHFFTIAGTSAAGIVLAAPLKNLYARAVSGQSVTGLGFGKLIPDRNGILDLPKGFQYKVISKAGEMMGDRTPVPTKQDGMAAFAGANGTTILVRNHELSVISAAANKQSKLSPIPIVTASEAQKYDKLAAGGTTTLIIDRDRKLIKQYVSLAGTVRNCGGGTTPWGSWISCEEDISTPATAANNSSDRLKESFEVSIAHGYNFEIPAQGGIVKPIPLKAMGRFRHEAIAVDPQTGYIYQTEDREDSCIYRFLPKQAKNLQAGGTLEALVIEGMPKVDTGIDFPMGEPKKVKWVKLEDVDPKDDTLRQEAQAKGAATFKRGEGMCFGNGEMFWTCTDGGKAGVGQIFRYNLKAETVELFVESPGSDVLDFPDNLILSPLGHLIVCEDGMGEQFLTGVNPKGECYHFARNALNQSELAGVCFSPDGKTMFVNIYEPGLTLAVWGNWGKG